MARDIFVTSLYTCAYFIWCFSSKSNTDRSNSVMDRDWGDM